MVVRRTLRRARALVSRLSSRDEEAPWRKRQAAALLARQWVGACGGELVYLDVGSAGAPDDRWQHLVDEGTVRTILVDMADDWSQVARPHSKHVTTVRAALGDARRAATVYVTRHPACSSCLRPNAPLLSAYPVGEWFSVVREESIELQRYDSIARERRLPQPHFAKVDVQGLEGRVLRGMGDVLDGTLCLETECQLRELYLGQDTFPTVYDYLTSKGFVLRDLKPQGPFEGEVVEFNALWSRRPTTEREREAIRLWELVTGVSSFVPFEVIDGQQRRAYRFNS